jgi:hypothetical protein
MSVYRFNVCDSLLSKIWCHWFHLNHTVFFHNFHVITLWCHWLVRTLIWSDYDVIGMSTSIIWYHCDVIGCPELSFEQTVMSLGFHNYHLNNTWCHWWSTTLIWITLWCHWFHNSCLNITVVSLFSQLPSNKTVMSLVVRHLHINVMLFSVHYLSLITKWCQWLSRTRIW